MQANQDYTLELLVKHGLIQSTDAEEARRNFEVTGDDPVQGLILQGYLTSMDVLRVVADESALAWVEQINDIPGEVVKTVPPSMVHRLGIVPLSLEGRHLRVAVNDPFNFDAIDTLSKNLKYEIEPVVAPEAEIQLAIKRYYSNLTDAVDVLLQGVDTEELTVRQSNADAGGTSAGDADAEIVKMVNKLLLEAYKMKASDIHLEPMEKRLRLRYRIDGVLQVMPDMPKQLQGAIMSRLKIMSNLSIAERRLPQDGRIQIATGEGRNTIDLRVSTIPTNQGESVVMRILDKSSLTLGLPELGFLTDDQATMERILNLPDGIFLVTGPTGSGKSTTLYACLNSINKPDRKIITVEDPVEYQLSGINQVPVNAEVGMTFAAALRAMLRQAPNIIMVGEIRDLETAAIAINASLTGHLVFSTLHTNDAPSAVTRLVDIGVKPFLVASSVRAIMAQRLVRRICSQCSEPYEPTAVEMKSLNLQPDQIEQANFRKGAGCDRCRDTGYKGRMGIFEICVLDDEIRRLVNEGASVSAVRNRARDLGMRTLRDDGIRKVLAGMTTPDEVISATMGDR